MRYRCVFTFQGHQATYEQEAACVLEAAFLCVAGAEPCDRGSFLLGKGTLQAAPLGAVGYPALTAQQWIDVFTKHHRKCNWKVTS